MEIALDQSMTFHKVLPAQYQALRLPTPMGVDNNVTKVSYSIRKSTIGGHLFSLKTPLLINSYKTNS